MVQFPSIIFFSLGFLQFLLGFSKVPVFLCHPVQINWSVKKVQIETAALTPVFVQQDQQVLKMAKDFFHQSCIVKNLSSYLIFYF